MSIGFADVIVDLQHGDSGKGKIAKHLARNKYYTHIVRYNGGNNAGHTIYHEGKKFVTHSVPCGVFHGIKSVIGPGCVVNVNHFLQEVKELEDAGIKCTGHVFIDERAHIITADHLSADSTESKIGTTHRGIGPAYTSKYARTGIRAKEVEELQPYLIDLYEEFYGQNVLRYARVLFEGAQGFGLDVDWGEYPYVTSSHCTVGSAIMNGIPPQFIREVWGIAKVYETYVGAKKFQPDDPIFEKLRDLGSEYGATTGRPRQCNWLNLKELNKAININGVNKLVFNKLDIFRQLNQWKLYDARGILRDLRTEQDFKQFIYDEIPETVSFVKFSENPEEM